MSFFKIQVQIKKVCAVLSSYLQNAENIKDVVEGEEAVIYSHQTTQPGGGGNQQEQKGISDGSTNQRRREIMSLQKYTNYRCFKGQKDKSYFIMES